MCRVLLLITTACIGSIVATCGSIGLAAALAAPRGYRRIVQFASGSVVVAEVVTVWPDAAMPTPIAISVCVVDLFLLLTACIFVKLMIGYRRVL